MHETHEVDGRFFVGVVGNGAHDRKRHAQFKTHLRHGGAFHFDGQQVGNIRFQLIQMRGAADELVAAGDQAAVDLRVLQAKRRDIGRLEHAGNIVTQKIFRGSCQLRAQFQVRGKALQSRQRHFEAGK